MTSFWKNKKILIIGGTGFIGKNFIKTLSKLEATVIFSSRKNILVQGINSIKLDPTIENDFKQIKGSFDLIINCAALDGNGNFKKDNSEEILYANSKISLNILDFARRKNIKNVVMFSSAEIYSGLKKRKVKEIDLKNINFNYPNGYQFSKLILELLSNFYISKKSEMNIYLPRPSYVYGVGDKYIDEINTRLIPMLIHRIKNGQKIEFYGGKTRKINLINVDDLIDGVLKMVEHNKVGPMNITSSELLTVASIINEIALQCGKKANVAYIRTNLRPSFLLDNHDLLKIKADFKPFKEGISEVIKRTS